LAGFAPLREKLFSVSGSETLRPLSVLSSVEGRLCVNILHLLLAVDFRESTR
jgi:hypothetical protein